MAHSCREGWVEEKNVMDQVLNLKIYSQKKVHKLQQIFVKNSIKTVFVKNSCNNKKSKTAIFLKNVFWR